MKVNPSAKTNLSLRLDDQLFKSNPCMTAKSDVLVRKLSVIDICATWVNSDALQAKCSPVARQWCTQHHRLLIISAATPNLKYSPKTTVMRIIN